MAKINNTNVYSPVVHPSLNDFLIGTSTNSEAKTTQSFTLGSICALFNRFLGHNTFVFADDLSKFPIGSEGLFYCFDATNQPTTRFEEMRKIVFSRADIYGDRVLELFKKMISSSSFVFKLTNNNDKDNFVFLTPGGFLEDTGTATFSIDAVLLSNLYTGSFMPNASYLVALELHPQTTSSNLNPIQGMELRIIARGATNNTNTDQPGDIVQGWGFWDSNTNTGTYWSEAIWNGGDRSDRANYTPMITWDKEI